MITAATGTPSSQAPFLLPVNRHWCSSSSPRRLQARHTEAKFRPGDGELREGQGSGPPSGLCPLQTRGVSHSALEWRSLSPRCATTSGRLSLTMGQGRQGVCSGFSPVLSLLHNSRASYGKPAPASLRREQIPRTQCPVSRDISEAPGYGLPQAQVSHSLEEQTSDSSRLKGFQEQRHFVSESLEVTA